MEFDEDEEPDDDEPEQVWTLPANPTDALPGTAAKIEVLRSRTSRGELLYHLNDMTYERVGDAISNREKRKANPIPILSCFVIKQHKT